MAVPKSSEAVSYWVTRMTDRTAWLLPRFSPPSRYGATRSARARFAMTIAPKPRGDGADKPQQNRRENRNTIPGGRQPRRSRFQVVPTECGEIGRAHV